MLSIHQEEKKNCEFSHRTRAVSEVFIMSCQHGALTPADEKEDPFPELIGWISHDDGGVKVAALNEHPEKVSHHEVVVNGRNQAAPRLENGNAQR